ncbi:MAG: menaquinol-cytochrome C reductase [Thermobacillus sp. ZCTH02-B1]|uniref:menaquinol-cytochrome c reductase cytochrome b/c subunit n=1 Tax=Thermobacillus sp. ZCTH02-B1 TaxID=1858795 RepID=UPI000B55415F|nr:menaquinol-cytochrome c reductase cytochrome b/c subunit [Thermobacillus sp. ZCTH02-B1]OUM96763.1 MAG: menaquinol-cytochrome C reductase [Thermobacillus sp. ZCTH02-B1]
MAQHSNDSKEKVVYVGDSRVKKSGRRPNIPPDYSAFPGKSEAFVPNFLLKEWMVGVVVLVGFLVLVVSHPAPLGYPADPNNTSFIPMPDWYFLFLYQFLKMPYVSGDYVVLGTVGVPLIMFGALLCAPFLDRGPERRFYKRPIASTLMFLAIISCVYLTYVAWDHYQDQLEEMGIVPEHIQREQEARRAAERGESPQKPGGAEEKQIAIVDANDPITSVIQANCLACHGSDYQGNGPVPALAGVGDKFSKEELADIVTNGRGQMPAFGDRLSAEEIDQIAEWLAKQKAATE